MRGRTVGVGVLAGLVALGACGAERNERFGPGTVLPDVTLPALAGGEPLALASLPGPAVVNLWATWCAPCRAELPAFARVSIEHREVAFVGVDIGEDVPEALAFLDELGVDTATFAQYGDPEAALTDALGVSALPVTILVGADDRVAEVHLGPMTETDLTAAIADL